MFYKYNILSLLLLFIDIQNCDNFHCTCYEEAGSQSNFRTCSVLAKIICQLLNMCGSHSYFLLLHNMCNGNYHSV